VSATPAALSNQAVHRPVVRRPRLGFLGVGWIGRHRLAAIADADIVEVVAIADLDTQCIEQAARVAPEATRHESLNALLELELDGIVIATPSALHAAQAIAALEHGVAVFCQKPLARTAAETRRVVAAARAANRLLAVDLSYRFTAAASVLRALMRTGELGRIYAADLVFHNAYGPDKSWFRDVRLSGGGCAIDLGIHLIDLAFWMLDWPPVTSIDARLFAGGRMLPRPATEVEDYCSAQLELAGGAVLRMACSWNLNAGRDAVIQASFYGSQGGCALRNQNGSFYDFVAERFRGTACERLVSPPDAWGGRAAVEWASRLATDVRYDPEIENSVTVAEALDRVYGR
jgi:predicted dehydrogenase